MHDASVQLLAYEYCLEYYVVMLNKVDMHSDSPVIVGMLHPEDLHPAKNLSDIPGRDVNPLALVEC